MLFGAGYLADGEGHVVGVFVVFVVSLESILFNTRHALGDQPDDERHVWLCENSKFGAPNLCF